MLVISRHLNDRQERLWRRQAWAHPVFVLLLLVLGAILTRDRYRVSYDDAFITYRYAENLASGRGFVYNPGEHVLGTTTPGYTWLLAIGHTLGLDVPALSGILSGAALTLLALLLYLTGRAWRQPILGALAALLALLHPFTLNTLGGEANVFTALVLAAYHALLRGRSTLGAAALALAFVVRADALLPSLLLFAWLAWRDRRLPVRALAVYAGLMIGLGAASWLSIGAVLPNTLEAKIAQGLSGYWIPFPRMLAHYVKNVTLPAPWLLIGFALVPLGAFVLPFREPQSLPLLAWGGGHLGAYLVLGVPFYHWYLVPAMPALALAAASGLVSLAELPAGLLHALRELIRARSGGEPDADLERTARALQAWRLAGTAAALVAATALLAGQVHGARLLKRAEPGAAEVMYRRLADWLVRNTPESASVAYYEIGWLGYDSKRRIIDMSGLVTPGVAEHVRAGDIDWAYREFRPDYIIYNELFDWTELRRQPWFAASYREQTRLRTDTYPTEIVVYARASDE